ncbi:MAG: DUF6448 family protein [Bryobacteraceae bacterium]
MKHAFELRWIAWSALLVAGLFTAQPASAHCDGIDGPVVAAARQALDTGNINLVLPWVQQRDEAEVGKAFSSTRAVRRLNPQAQELADRYFFEVVVRLHRSGEGEPFTGLKPAGRDLGPVIPAADRAIETGSAESLAKTISAAAGDAVRERFKRVSAQRVYAKDDVAAGREYVKEYVGFVHFVETLHQAVHGNGHDHAVKENE